MNRIKLSMFAMAILALASCVSKKQFTAVQTDLKTANEQLGKCGESLNDYMARLTTCTSDLNALRSEKSIREEQVADLRAQLADCKEQRDKQLTQVGDLTVMSQGANDNMKLTLSQLAEKDKYIHRQVSPLPPPTPPP